jgi:hypothetical protein
VGMSDAERELLVRALGAAAREELAR